MKPYKPLPIGVDSFEKIREGAYYYVDKSLLIKELLDMKGETSLFTRPRRFGKTLNLSMLRYFFEASENEAMAEKRRGLFSGLAILDAGEQYTAQMGKYPVISLTLKSGRQSTWESAYYMLRSEIAREYDRHSIILNSDRLTDANKEQFLRLRDRKGNVDEYKEALQFLSVCMEKIYEKKTIILIDEYDVPLENAFFCGFYNEMLGFLRALFESALKTNEALEFAVMTGCLRISKESIFTGLNNLNVMSVLDQKYAEHFGFTQQEIENLYSFYGFESRMDNVRTWYDGYLFGDTEVYNPWSAIKFAFDLLSDLNALEKPYWSNTSGNAIVRSLIERANSDVKQEIEVLIAGGTIEKPVHEDVTYGEMDSTMDGLWNFLFFTGYLTKVSERKEGRDIYMTMRVPNEEVLYIYENHIRSWFAQKVATADLSALFTATLEGDAKTLEGEIRKLLMESISYMDSREAFYHGFLTGLYKAMGDYLVRSNRESGNGRYDILIFSQDSRKPAALIEVKAADTFSQLESKSAEALAQIEGQAYEQDLREEGITTIYKYGVAFYRKNCRVAS